MAGTKTYPQHVRDRETSDLGAGRNTETHNNWNGGGKVKQSRRQTLSERKGVNKMQLKCRRTKRREQITRPDWIPKTEVKEPSGARSIRKAVTGVR